MKRGISLSDEKEGVKIRMKENHEKSIVILSPCVQVFANTCVLKPILKRESVVKKRKNQSCRFSESKCFNFLVLNSKYSGS